MLQFIPGVCPICQGSALVRVSDGPDEIYGCAGCERRFRRISHGLPLVRKEVFGDELNPDGSVRSGPHKVGWLE